MVSLVFQKLRFAICQGYTVKQQIDAYEPLPKVAFKHKNPQM